MDREQLITELARWIDTQVIAEAIVDHLEREGMELTLQNGKDAWLAQMETLLT
jgi:menaquinone-dependent protoporphyrinogen IX oxidase